MVLDRMCCKLRCYQREYLAVWLLTETQYGALQVEVYKHVLRSNSVAALMSGRASEPSDGVLSIITSLRKLCNHPDLLHSSSGHMLSLQR